MDQKELFLEITLEKGMKVRTFTIDGLLEIRPKVFQDDRGYFLETWEKSRYAELGITAEFVQDNHSFSRKGTLRGLHYQNPHSQGKLITVFTGKIFDVAVDLRSDSKTFGKHETLVLDAEIGNQLWIPPGFAHGFLVMSESAHLFYKCTDFYHPEYEGSIAWDDADLFINWPCGQTPILSPKDSEAPSFKSYCRKVDR